MRVRPPLWRLTCAAHCKVCGTDLSGQASGDGPAVFVIFIVGAIVVGLALLVEIRHSPPVWLHLVLWLPLPLSMILLLGPMRPFKATLTALQFKHRPQDLHE
jgi:uncharacterized protein (DUF983 family)